LFAEERKRALPERPRLIGIVTSPTGAALQDMLNTLQRRYPLAEVVLAPAAVQGANAPGEIVRGIAALNRVSGVDVILVARGGGSLEDLWAFNDETVVRAVAASAVPVVSGVGHETDFTLSDFAADKRAPTPTGAAVIVTPDVADLRTNLNDLQNQLETAGEDALETARLRLDESARRLERASPDWRVRNERQRMDEMNSRLGRAAAGSLLLRRAHQNGAIARLTALNPQAVLQRGYAIVHTADGTLVRRAAQMKTGQPINLTMVDGEAGARVERIEIRKDSE